MRLVLFYVILALPVVVSAGLVLATRRWIIAALCGAIILPVMLLISVAVWPPGPRTEWQITLILAIIWGSMAGSFGTAVSWAELKRREKRRKSR
jgi:hypothetical protein